MKTILLVRHGITDWNEQRKWQGWTDIALNANGRGQAQQAKELFQKFNPQKVFASPLSRAYETAEIICDGKHEIHKDARLKEINLGEAEGVENQHIATRFSEEIANSWLIWGDSPFSFGMPGGETRGEAFARIQGFYDECLLPAKEDRIALVAHGVFIKIFLFGFAKTVPEQIGNLDMFEVNFDFKNNSVVWRKFEA